MSKQRTIVVLGGALAGPTAAARARETDEHARIVMIERAATVSYAVGGLSNVLAGEVDSSARLDRERAEFFRDLYNVEVRTGAEVDGIDPRGQAVRIGGEKLSYDALIFAMGASTIMPDVPGLDDARNVFPFRSLEHLRGIAAVARRGRRVAVIGGAFFGVEAADGLLRRGVEVIVIERGPRLLPSFSTAASGAARASLEAAGARVVTNATLANVELKAGAVRALNLTDGTSIACDAVVIATGVRPRTEMLAAAGARLLRDHTVRIDEHCATSLPNVWACGACVSLEHAVSGRLVWLPQASIADKTAQVAGASAAGGFARMGRVMGTAIVRAGEYTIARTGLTRDEAEGCDTVSVHAPSHDRFLRDATNVSLELMFDPANGRILGADAWGERGVDKRIDVLATAIAGDLDLDELTQLDLAYAPTYGTERDAVNVVATVAAQARANPGITWSATDLLAARERGGLTLVHVGNHGTRKVPSIVGATTMSLTELRAGSETLKRAPGMIVFISDNGAHGYLAAKIARARGFADAGYLAGGTASWHAEGFALVPVGPAKPVVTPAATTARAAAAKATKPAKAETSPKATKPAKAEAPAKATKPAKAEAPAKSTRTSKAAAIAKTAKTASTAKTTKAAKGARAASLVARGPR